MIRIWKIHDFIIRKLDNSGFSGYNIAVIKKEINHKNVTVNWNNVIMKKQGFQDCEYSTFIHSDLPAYIRSVGHFKLYEIDRTSCQMASFCELYWCIEGKGCFEFEGKKHLVRPGEVWYYPENTMQYFYPAEDNFFHYRWFTIAGRLAPALFESAGIPPGTSYGGRCPEELFGELELLIRQSTQSKRLKQLSTGFEILCRAASGVRRKRPLNNYLDEARNMIDHDFSNPELNIHSLSEILHVNRVQLSRNFSQQFGVTISGYLRNLRLQKGLELLRETSLPIAEIALSSGFASADYFGKVICAVTGKKPSAHRTGGQKGNSIPRGKRK